jgi:hypothetical protein
LCGKHLHIVVERERCLICLATCQQLNTAKSFFEVL